MVDGEMVDGEMVEEEMVEEEMVDGGGCSIFSCSCSFPSVVHTYSSQQHRDHAGSRSALQRPGSQSGGATLNTGKTGPPSTKRSKDRIMGRASDKQQCRSRMTQI